ncbi:MAG: 4Fe-4S dicluster domain-containing protein [Magnetococcales bacterium]|nr:4Fe-4S dicluster domain-containing protein [Magnetococcales bacterium]
MRESEEKLLRRELLNRIGLGAATAAVAVTLPAGAGAAVARDPVHYAMVIDTRRCIGCQACSVACKAEFAVPLGATRSWVEYVEKGTFPHVSRQFLPRLCNHCRNPQCVNVCPTGATFKRAEDGIVVVDPEVCIGCKYCIQACPYDARFIHPDTGAADKCDFCLHRVGRGLVPACVNTCQGRARIFGDMNDPASAVAQLIATQPVTVLRQGMGTRPSVFYIAADHSDPRETRVPSQYVRVDTHRRIQERR